MKGRGNVTWLREKKPYKIKFENKVDIFNMGKAKTYNLLNNYMDDLLVSESIYLPDKGALGDSLFLRDGLHYRADKEDRCTVGPDRVLGVRLGSGITNSIGHVLELHPHHHIREPDNLIR